MPRSRPSSTPARADEGPLLPLAGAIALAAAIAFLAVAALRQLWATDLGWQLATGRLVLASGPPHVDALSYTHAGRPWIELRWLWCAAIAALWAGPGPAAVSWLAWGLHVGAFALALLARLRRASAPAASALLVLAVVAASQRLFARPEAVSALAFATGLFLLDRDRRRPSWTVALLVPLQVAWVNAHTLFALGPVAVGLALAAAAFERARGVPEAATRLRRAGLLLAAVLAACFANPYGARVFGFTLLLVREAGDPAARALIDELRSPLTLPGWLAVRAGLLLAAVTLLLTAWRVRRADAFLTATCGLALVLAAGSVRSLPLFALAAVPHALALLAPAPGERSWPARVHVALSAIAAVAALGLGWAVATDRFTVSQHDTNRFGTGLVPLRYPEQAARTAAALRGRDGRPPRVFGTFLESSWLLAAGVPSWGDPRLEVFGPAHLARGVAATGSPAAFAALASEHDVRAALAVLEDARFLRTLQRLPGWALVHVDPVAAVFADTARVAATALGPGAMEAFAAEARAALPPPRPWRALGPFQRAKSATPYQRVGNALMLLARRADLAEPFLRDAVAAEPHSASAHLAWAEALEARGAAGSARAERQRAVALAPNDPEALGALALQHLMEGRAPAAAPLLERAVSRHPAHARSWALLGEARALLGRRAEAAQCLERAVRLDPANEQYARRLAVVRGSP